MCLWYERLSGANEDDEWNGLCHRWPPLRQTEDFDLFLRVCEEDWCGEFVQKETRKPGEVVYE
jgi:hypothetical protein